MEINFKHKGKSRVHSVPQSPTQEHKENLYQVMFDFYFFPNDNYIFKNQGLMQLFLLLEKKPIIELKIQDVRIRGTYISDLEN